MTIMIPSSELQATQRYKVGIGNPETNSQMIKVGDGILTLMPENLTLSVGYHLATDGNHKNGRYP